MKQDQTLISFGGCLVYMGLGESNQDLVWLEKAYAERSSWLLHIKVEPRLDPLRDDPRFQALLRRMNFPENQGSSD